MSEYRLQFKGTLFPIRAGEITLGRSSYASIVVNNPLTSREHAIVRSVGGKIEVVDLGSKNGTLVNGKRIVGAERVEAGDQIKIGTDVLEVVRVLVQDPRELRAQTYPGRLKPAKEEGETTVHAQDSLEVAEALLGACTTESQRRPTAETLVQVLNEFLSNNGPGDFTDSELERVRRISETVGGWNLGPPVEEWRRIVQSRIGAASGA